METSVSRKLVAVVGAALMALAASTLGAGPAEATSSSAKWNLPGGDQWQVNAWHCGTYTKTCAWTTSVKLLGSNPSNAQRIKNRSELEAHGVSVSIEISKEPKATLVMTSKSLGQVTWTNTNSWIADLSGSMTPNWTTLWVSTRSCGSGTVNGSIKVSEKCVYAGAA